MRTLMVMVIGQSPARHLPTVFIGMAAVAILVMLVVIVAVVLRKRMKRDDSDTATPFTLDGLRQMKAAGQVTAEEYERMKAGMLARYRHAQAQAHDLDQQADPDAPLDLNSLDSDDS